MPCLGREEVGLVRSRRRIGKRQLACAFEQFGWTMVFRLLPPLSTFDGNLGLSIEPVGFIVCFCVFLRSVCFENTAPYFI